MQARTDKPATARLHRGPLRLELSRSTGVVVCVAVCLCGYEVFSGFVTDVAVSGWNTPRLLARSLACIGWLYIIVEFGKAFVHAWKK